MAMTNTEHRTVTTHYVGRTTDGERLFVDISLRPIKRVGETVEHDYVSDAQEFAASGALISYRARTPFTLGQILRNLNNIATPAKGWTMADIDSLYSIWRRWHLNGMRAACAHMPEDSFNKFVTVKCSRGDYTYGAKWLIEPLPADIIGEIQRLQGLPTGKIPDTI